MPPIELFTTIEQLISRGLAQNLLDYLLTLLAFQLARRIDGAATAGELPQSGPKDRDLPLVKVGKIFRLQSPLDLWIAGQCSRAGARDVSQNAIEAIAERKIERVGVDDLHVGRTHAFAQQLGAMRVQLGGDDFRRGITSCDRGGLSPRGGTAIQQTRPVPN